jgi:hypothetical protein
MIENSPAFQRRESSVSSIRPEGTADWTYLWQEFSRPLGTRLCLPVNPALKRWAIFMMSLRDNAFGAADDLPKDIMGSAGRLQNRSKNRVGHRKRCRSMDA